MEKQLKRLSPLLVAAFFLLFTTNASTTTSKTDSITTIWASDQCKDVIQESPEFSFCLKAISQKWPTELAVLPCCRQFKKMDETCRCEALKLIIDAAVAAAAAPSEGELDGLVPPGDAESRDAAK